MPIQSQPKQLVLDVKLHANSSFDSFICHEKNKSVIEFLSKIFQEFDDSDEESVNKNKAKKIKQSQSIASKVRYVYLHGKQAVGKTHLLQALSHAAQKQGLQSIYLPLQELCDQPASSVLAGLESTPVICIDNIESVKNSSDWQQQLFHLYNRVKDLDHYLFVTGSDVPDALGLDLADLVSRLKWGLTYRVTALDDEGLKSLLKTQIDARGIRVEDDVIEYILTRAQRSTKALTDIIEQLDQASWEKQRAITKPFIKSLLNW